MGSFSEISVVTGSTSILFDKLRELADAKGGTDKLRELILQLAVQGKLVPQDPDDEPAEELLQSISSQRKILIANGDIKVKKSDPVLTGVEEDEPVPAGWSQTHIWQLLRKAGAGSTPLGGKKSYVEEGVIFLRSQNVWNSGLRLQGAARIKSETHEKMKNTHVQPCDILLNITGASIGRCAIVPSKMEPANVSQHVAILRLIDTGLVDFLHLVIISPHFQQTIMAEQVGVSREGLSMTSLKKFVVPLPPLAEQKRIVAKVDELMALCDQLEQQREHRVSVRETASKACLEQLTTTESKEELATAWHRVGDNFELLYDTPETVQQLRQSILELAVQGKLVPQDPEDEPAEALLAVLHTRKHRLLESGIIRKEKAYPSISDDEIPHSLPSTWVWVRVGELSAIVEYGTSEKSAAVGPGVPVLRMGNIQNGAVLLDNVKYVSPDIADLPKLYLRDGDLLFNRTNSWELVGKTGVFRGPSEKFTFASYLIRLRTFVEVDPDFVNFAMNAPYYRFTQIEPTLTQQCGQANFNGTKMKNSLVPLPPLAEQKRIVAKVDELMALCDQLEQQVTHRQETTQRLLEATVAAVTSEANQATT